MSGDELVLTESKTMRAKFRDHVDALDKVKVLIVLPDSVHATSDMVADYFEVEAGTVQQIVKRHRDELESNGLHTLRGAELREWKGRYRSYLPSAVVNSSQLTVFPRQAILNVGQLLTESPVARKVRQYLLAVEATATEEHKRTAVEVVRLQERMDYQQILHSLKAGGAVNDDYGHIQNLIYVGLFGKTAAQIRATQVQRSGVPRKRCEGFRKSTTAKDYLTENQLGRLNSAVLIVVAQLQLRYPDGATAAEMADCVQRSLAMVGSAA